MQTIISLKRIKISLYGLTVFDDIRHEDKMDTYYQLLDALTADKINSESIYTAYFKFYKAIMGYNFVAYIIERLLNQQNQFAILSAGKGYEEMDKQTIQNAERDLRIIQDLAMISPEDLKALISERFTNEISENELEVFSDLLCPDNWPRWDWNLNIELESDIDFTSVSAAEWFVSKKNEYMRRFISQENWAKNVQLLADYYHKVGCGLFGGYGAFKLQETGGQLQGIENPDPIRVSNLICQEREQTVVLNNTKSFLKGYPANNIILYGNRGTGKSSLVKALLNEYVSEGLRLVQLKKNQIGIFPNLVKELSKIPLKFIIFIDDLSFNDVEEDYKNLKSLLEGGVEARPDNVLVYATSNRKHLVKESFADRRSDDIHAHDNMEEKLSLADRFGITVTFLSPDQETYLRIVEGLALQHKLNIDKDELRQKALKWVMMHNGRSGRTARQFIDHLMGELDQSHQ